MDLQFILNFDHQTNLLFNKRKDEALPIDQSKSSQNLIFQVLDIPPNAAQHSSFQSTSPIISNVISQSHPTNCLQESSNICSSRIYMGPLVSVVGKEKRPVRKRKQCPYRPSKRTDLICDFCQVRESPEWRTGPSGTQSLCNACGLRWRKKLKRAEQNKRV